MFTKENENTIKTSKPIKLKKTFTIWENFELCVHATHILAAEMHVPLRSYQTERKAHPFKLSGIICVKYTT